MRSVAAVLLCLAVVGTACSDDEEDATSSFCEDRTELQNSFQDLRDVNVVDDGVEALDDQLDVMLADVEELSGSAGDLQPEVDAVTSSITSLQQSIDSTPSGAGKADALVSGLAEVSAVLDELLAASGSQCD
jgi:peptidoglycan hydrolase CwlO-like protein